MRAVLLLFILALGLRVHNAWAEVPGTSPKCADIYTGKGQLLAPRRLPLLPANCVVAS